MVCCVLLLASSFLFIAAYQKYTHASALLEEVRKIAHRVLLIKRRS